MNQANLWDGVYRRIGKKGPGEDLPWIAAHLAYFEKRREQIIVDLGCGMGKNAIYLHDQGYQVIACDFSPIALETLAQHRPGIETHCFDMTQGIPLARGNIGVVLASLSTHYFSLEDTLAVHRAVLDLLEPGGIFLLRVNSLQDIETRGRRQDAVLLEPDYYQQADGTTRRYFSMASLSDTLTGFELLALREIAFTYHGHEKHCIEAIARKGVS